MLTWGLNKKTRGDKYLWREVEKKNLSFHVMKPHPNRFRSTQPRTQMDLMNLVFVFSLSLQSGRGGALDLSVLLLSSPPPNPTGSRLYTQPKALTWASYSASPGLLQGPVGREPIFVLMANSWSLTSIKIEFLPIPLLPPSPASLK